MRVFGLVGLLTLVVAAGCTGTAGSPDHVDGGADTNQINTDSALPGCGNGLFEPGEMCDDGNQVSGDGCNADCTAIEDAYICATPGQPCQYTAVCGDAILEGRETCDDQNTASGDGCSASCELEPGWICPIVGATCIAAACGDGIVAGGESCEDDDATPASGDGCSADCQLERGFKCPVAGQACVATVCNDGVREGLEPCDDGNNDMGDGCTPFCQIEPTCTPGSGCVSTCGDGFKIPGDSEACDDGNTVAGDGCSPTCQIEPGFMCSDQPVGAGATLELPIVLRDFQDSHPDFEAFLGTEQGIVQSNLGATGKPQYAHGSSGSATTTNQSNFDQWYRDTPGVNQTILQTLTLQEQAPAGSGIYQFNDSAFFPLDGLGYGNQGNPHNYHFTSEVRYWFEYKGGEVLDFTGDDDVFVFINGKLAVDLGGVHGAINGSITLDAATASQFSLVVGKVYEAVVFQAERHTEDSNYRLTLSGFEQIRSSCQHICGDGIVTKFEACDDGVNDGSYNSCTSNCLGFGPRCGDGIVQSSEGEQCDDGNRVPGDGCNGTCKQEGPT